MLSVFAVVGLSLFFEKKCNIVSVSPLYYIGACFSESGLLILCASVNSEQLITVCLIERFSLHKHQKLLLILC